MLNILVGETEYWDEVNDEFVTKGGTMLQLEHSLVSISKWESKWHKPFIGSNDRTIEETIDYIKCMTITQNVKPEVYDKITNSKIDQINAYIDDPMTASTITEIQRQEGASPKKEKITSELIYYWMISLEIPFECQRWHLNRLMMLIRICSIKNQPDNKMSQKQTMKHNAALNAARRAKNNSKG